MPGLTLSERNANEIHTEILFRLYHQIRGGRHSALTKVQEQANSPALWRIEMGAASSLAVTVIQMHMCIGPGIAWAGSYATDNLYT